MFSPAPDPFRRPGSPRPQDPRDIQVRLSEDSGSRGGGVRRLPPLRSPATTTPSSFGRRQGVAVCGAGVSVGLTTPGRRGGQGQERSGGGLRDSQGAHRTRGGHADAETTGNHLAPLWERARPHPLPSPPTLPDRSRRSTVHKVVSTASSRVRTGASVGCKGRRGSPSVGVGRGTSTLR